STPCADGTLCTHGDTCKSGKCTAGSTPNCDDKIACSKDYCDAKTGACVNEVIVGCGNYCETDGHCDDSKLCTTESCVKGKCVYQNNQNPCDDGNDCTKGDVCNGGKCAAGKAVWVSHEAGATGGYLEGEAAKARFNQPHGLAFEADGSLLIADASNHRIRRLKGGAVATAAGGTAGYADGAALSSRFNLPADVAIDGANKVYVADRGNHRLRLIAGGKVSTIAGATAGFADGKGVNARFYNPFGVAVTKAGVAYVADYSNNRIRKVAPDGTVTTLAGAGSGYNDGAGVSAKFAGPIGVALDSRGSLYVTDYRNHRLRRVTPEGQVSTVAGSTAGFANGSGSLAKFYYPWGVAVSSNGTIFVADRATNRIRNVTPTGVVGLFAGSGTGGYINGDGVSARFNSPRGLVTDSRDGSVLVADAINHRIRRLLASASPCKIGGSCIADGHHNPVNDCQRCAGAKAATSWSKAADKTSCNDDKLCTVSDQCASGTCAGSTNSCDDKDACTSDSCDAKTGACLHKKIIGCKGYCEANSHCDDKNVCTNDACVNNLCQHSNNTSGCDDGSACTAGDVCKGGKCTAGVQTLVATLAGSTSGFADGKGTAAKFQNPAGVHLMSDGSVLVADYTNHRVRRVKPDGTTSTVAGSGNEGFKDGVGTAAWFNRPSDVTTDAAGNIYVTDRYNHRIRAIDAQGAVTTLAGSPQQGNTDGVGGGARFAYPIGLAQFGGHLAVGDYSNHRIRLVTIATKTTTTLAGSTAGYADGKGGAAKFSGPAGVDFDHNGDVIVAEYGNHRIRRVSPQGVVTTIAGFGTAGLTEGDVKSARFNRPWSVVADPSGRIFVADRHNHRIRMIFGGLVVSIAGTSAGVVDGDSSKARLYYPTGLARDAKGKLFVGGWSSQRVRTVTVTANACAISGGCWASGVTNPANSCQVCSGGAKTWSTAKDGVTCSDGKACTIADSCKSGTCAATGVVCNDNDKCTTDSCDAATGACKFTAIKGCK
ncbi:MAG: SMP-30/gluconolactonase/LRE family protein, partial [Myxococcales bacterium]|nr:SMP-30/gluconolactonase/LRE family protein [Myxococcales bacterium]